MEGSSKLARQMAYKKKLEEEYRLAEERRKVGTISKYQVCSRDRRCGAGKGMEERTDAAEVNMKLKRIRTESLISGSKMKKRRKKRSKQHIKRKNING